MPRRHEMFPGQKIAARYRFSANRHFSRDQFIQQFKRFTRVVARLLHGVLCMTTRISISSSFAGSLSVEPRGFEPLTSACKVRGMISWLFAGVQKYLQISIFLSDTLRACSPMFVGGGVLLV